MGTESLGLTVVPSGRLMSISVERLRIAVKADDLSAFSGRIQINELSNLVHDQRVRQQSGYNIVDVLNARNL